MSTTDPITSTTNPRVKALARLKERKGRTESGRFLIEGHRELERAAAASVPIDEIVLAPELAGERERTLASELAAGTTVVLEVGRAVFEKLSMRRHPDGRLGVARHTTRTIDALPVHGRAMVLVLDGIEKPGNLGGILRSADAAGVDAVILSDGRVESTNPNTIRASQGAVFSVPMAEADAATARTWIEGLGLRIVAASPEAPTTIWDADLTGGVALVIGAEAHGIGPVFRTPDVLVRIPMVGAADSLNSSVTAGIMLFEAVRQRS